MCTGAKGKGDVHSLVQRRWILPHIDLAPRKWRDGRVRIVGVYTLDFHVWEIRHGDCYFNRNCLDNLKYELLELSCDGLFLILLIQVPGRGKWWQGNANTISNNGGPSMTLAYLENPENEVDVPRKQAEWSEYCICRFYSKRACKLMFNSVFVFSHFFIFEEG